MEIITAVRGFKDILPGETEKWQYVEEKARGIFKDFGLSEIKVPVLEKTNLFKRGIGETTDIVEKEMYTFEDVGGEHLTLRPEATASVIRAYLQHNMHAADPVAKLFTIGPMFRRERPQKGRFRQFHQINVELIGLDDPRMDAELILMLICFLESVRLSDLKLEINSLGCSICRPSFRKEILHFLQDKKSNLCEDCLRRLDTNPLRVFDCKMEGCREIISNAPKLLDYICPECQDHFEKVKEYLISFDILFKINTKMVRGLDYYTRTAFEVTTESLGAQNAIAGGGRYDRLIEELGGPDIPGTGFAIGLERLISMLPMKNEEFLTYPHLFIAALGDEAQKFAYTLCNDLRRKGIRTEMDYSSRSLKSQMRRSNKLNSHYTLILGEKEMQEKKAELRNMKEGTQETLSLDDIENIIKMKISKYKIKK
ncbi:MAG: histidine--tRNA ligase [Thermodesulfobacteriota bacterium]|nr:histidine--tRNA ligase [Thermodesulfobacteriota bacterium]